MNKVTGRVTASVVGVLGLVLGTPTMGLADGPASVELSMSNFRFCAASSCTPADVGYVRTKEGPLPGADNPAAIVDVPGGATVRWVYRDVGPGSCDSFEQCAGHNVRLDDGSAKGTGLGFTRARGGETAITTTIRQPAGTLIRYFCSVNDHYQLGMTGLLRVT